jgi:hypothetical protein
VTTTSRQKQDLSTPWDAILGTRSQVRAIRVLERDREPMTVREVSRRAHEHLRATQTAVSRLVEVGLVQRVGTGSQQLVRWNTSHPLAPPLSALFQAERARYRRILEGIVELVRAHASSARFVWMTDHPEVGGPRIEIGVLSSSADVDQLVDALRSAVVPLMQSEDLLIEVRGWTLPDLEMMDTTWLREPGALRHVWGTPPSEFVRERPEETVRPKSHQMIDAELRERAKRLASLIQSQPELVRLAKEEIATKLEQTVGSPEARTLREWQQVLEGMSVSRLTRWLVGDGERATRLRQSMPLVFVRAMAEAPDEEEGDRP